MRSELSPKGDDGHNIILQEGTPAINVRPYKYSVILKYKIEKMIQELLSSGVIRPSVSPYSSPIVLVKKKDGT